MSPQPSNRQALLEGTLRSLATMPIDQISARVVAKESGANLASIGYHFGSKDALVTAAVVEGLDRWLVRIGERLSAQPSDPDPEVRFQRAVDAAEATKGDHAGIARAFVVALGRGHHDAVVAQGLTEGFMHTRRRVADLLDLGSDDTGTDAGAVVHAVFTGLLVQSLLSQELVIDGSRITAALRRIVDTLDADVRITPRR
jgi:AcrR family transcriptional regulator